MNIKQNDIEYLSDQVEIGKMTADRANIENVRLCRVKMILGSCPASVRKALNSAVKIGYLAHKKKEKYKPEVYYHPDFEYLANKERNDYESGVLENLRKICI